MAYKAAALRNLAIAQMVFGSLMFVFGIISIFAVHHWSSYVGFGVWLGIWVIITGVLGYIGARNDSFPNKCLVGTFMGFSITACVLTSSMFISYSIALSEFAARLRCSYDYYDYDYDRGLYYDSDCYYSGYRYIARQTARTGAGLGSCLLIFSIVEFFVALASSIYCCNAVCCNSTLPTVATQQVIYAQPQQIYQGGQPGVVVIQPSGQVTTMQAGYPGQPAVFVPQQPAYWTAGATPSGAVLTSYPTAGTVQAPAQAQQPLKNVERPPPYSPGVAPVASDHPQAVGTYPSYPQSGFN